MILNVQKDIDLNDNSIKYVYKEVGNWNNHERLSLDLEHVKFPLNNPIHKSICSEKCEFGHVKVNKRF